MKKYILYSLILVVGVLVGFNNVNAQSAPSLNTCVSSDSVYTRGWAVVDQGTRDVRVAKPVEFNFDNQGWSLGCTNVGECWFKPSASLSGQHNLKARFKGESQYSESTWWVGNPGKVNNLKAEVLQDNRVKLTWDQPSFTNGTSSYVVSGFNMPGGTASVGLSSGEYITPPMTTIGLTYYWTVWADNGFCGLNNDAKSVISTKMTVAPPAPAVKAYPRDKAVLVSWDRPKDNSGKYHFADSYNVYNSGGSNPIANTSSLQYLVTNLNVGQEYCFEVSAINSGKEGSRGRACATTSGEVVIPPSGTTNVTIQVKDKSGASVDGATVTLGGTSISGEVSSNIPKAYPVPNNYPYSIIISIPSGYTMASNSDGNLIRGNARIDHQVSGIHCSANRDRCKEVLNYFMHPNDGGITRSADPANFNYFLELDRPSDGIFSFTLERNVPRPSLNTISIPSEALSGDPVTFSWTGNELGFCSPLFTPSSPALMSGPFPSANDGLSGSHSFNAPTVSSPVTYIVGLDCNNSNKNNSEAIIRPLNLESRSKVITIKPRNNDNGEGEIISVEIPTTITAPPAPAISGLVHDENGVGVPAVVVINQKEYNTSSIGSFYLNRDQHGLLHAGSYQVSINLPSGYESVRAVNARNNNDSVYRYQVLGAYCDKKADCQNLFDRYGRRGSADQSKTFDLDSDSAFEFVVYKKKIPKVPPVIPPGTTEGTNPGTTPGEPALPQSVSVNFYPEKYSANRGESIWFDWSSSDNVKSCVASSNDPSSSWNGSVFTSGREYVTINQGATFELTCYGLTTDIFDYKYFGVSVIGDADPVLDPGNPNNPPNNIPNPDFTVPPAFGNPCNSPGATASLPACDSGYTGSPQLVCRLVGSSYIWTQEGSCEAIPVTLSCTKSDSPVKNVITGASVDISSLISCTATDGSGVGYSVSGPVDVTVQNNKFTPTTSGIYTITTVSDAGTEDSKSITINVFDPDVQEVSP